MLKIGSILHKDELVNHTKVDYIEYIDFNDGDSLVINTDIPTLVVGWNNVKGIIDNKEISILNKEYVKNKKYWEFAFNENKAQHVGGIEMFVRNTPYYYFREKYTYHNLDPIFHNIISLENLKNIIQSGEWEVYQYKDEMVYLLIDNKIYGIDLKMYEYFKIDINEITSFIKEESIRYYHDDDGSEYQNQYKKFPFFEELKRYLVVLLSKA